MKVGSLFSGIGGFDLGLERAGMQVIWQSEIEPYCCDVLKKHWPDVPNLGDIFKIKNPSAVDLICGGFPCQPFSVAGKRKGKADDRYIWPEMLRIITEVKPHWVFAENVPGIIHMELDQVLSDLEGQGYETGTLIIPACAVNAPHRRDRIWIVGYNNKWVGDKGKVEGMAKGEKTDPAGSGADASHPIGSRTRGQGGETSDKGRRTREGGRTGIRQGDGEAGSGGVTSTDRHASDTKGGGQLQQRQQEDDNREERRGKGLESNGKDKIYRDAPDTEGVRCRGWANSGCQLERTGILQNKQTGCPLGNKDEGCHSFDWQESWPEVATRLCRVDDGLPAWVHRHRVKRLKALGNAIVPQIAQEIGRMILEIEKL